MAPIGTEDENITACLICRQLFILCTNQSRPHAAAPAQIFTDPQRVAAIRTKSGSVLGACGTTADQAGRRGDIKKGHFLSSCGLIAKFTDLARNAVSW